MARTLFLMVVMCAALAGAQVADARPERAHEPAQGPPEHAQAHGREARDAPPEPAPEAPPASEPGPETAPPEENAPATVEVAPAAPTPAEPAPLPEPSLPAPASEDVVLAAPVDALEVAAARETSGPEGEERRAPVPLPAEEPPVAPGADAGAALAGIAAPAPGAATSSLHVAPSAGAPSATPWLRALWALPLLGAFGAVIMLRRATTAPRALPLADVTVEAQEPRDVREALERGHAATKRGDLEAAVSAFDAALRMAPGLGVALFCRGVCLAALGRMGDAHASLQASVRDDPTDGARRVHLARAALALGRAKEAMDAVAPLAESVPEVGDALLDDPQLAGLRDHPRFLALCGRL